MSRQINLFNPAVLPRRALLPARQMLLGWAAVLLAGLGLYVWEYTQAAQLRIDERAAEDRVKALQADLVRLGGQSAGRKPTAALVAKVAQRQGLLGARQNTMQLLAGGSLGDTEGHARYLRAFARQSIDGLWLTGLTIDGSGADISVQGRTVDPALVPDFLRRLGSEPVLAGHGFDHLLMQRPQAAAGTAPAGEVTPRYVEFSVETRPQTAKPATADKS